MCNNGITVLPATHTRTIPAFTPQPQGVTTLWLVLIAPTHEGMASGSAEMKTTNSTRNTMASGYCIITLSAAHVREKLLSKLFFGKYEIPNVFVKNFRARSGLLCKVLLRKVVKMNGRSVVDDRTIGLAKECTWCMCTPGMKKVGGGLNLER